MITKQDLIDLYNWAKDIEFPCKTPPVVEGYCNKPIDYYWIKSVKKSTLIREKLMTDKVRKIYDNDDILFSNYAIFYAGTILKPHKDPNILRCPYKRIQIPLTIPNQNDCYIQWIGDKNGKVIWEEGVPQVCDVMNHLHEAFNKSDEPMEILFVDVKHNTEVKI